MDLRESIEVRVSGSACNYFPMTLITVRQRARSGSTHAVHVLQEPGGWRRLRLDAATRAVCPVATRQAPVVHTLRLPLLKRHATRNGDESRDAQFGKIVRRAAGRSTPAIDVSGVLARLSAPAGAHANDSGPWPRVNCAGSLKPGFPLACGFQRRERVPPGRAHSRAPEAEVRIRGGPTPGVLRKLARQ